METATRATELPGELRYIQYEHALEEQYLPAIRALISKDLSEPYSIYVYRYFLYQWAHLCYMVSILCSALSLGPNLDLECLLHIRRALHPDDGSLIGVIICKLEHHASHSPATHRGYIAMLAVSSAYRGHGIATALVKMAIDAMSDRNADEVVLETEETNTAAMRLYERLGFLRSKKLHRYYLNGNSAYRLVLLLKSSMRPPPPLLPLDSASAAAVTTGGGSATEDARPVSPTH
ncbi:ribosomal-protein-alanine N-acetyltransferase [Apiospora rasikravindrae]|uniref:Ribosomal-protein-alanine N-acetyltransferase n=1 Tax=Apiospora rasikravindrae TaxID=990691 RepID=A0ABR1TFZ5_9PEZI